MYSPDALADQIVAIFGSALDQIGDEGFDLITIGIPPVGGPAVVGCIGFHETRIELANQQSEAVAEARLAVLVAVVSSRGSLTLIGECRGVGPGSPAKFLDRSESDAVGFSEGAVDGAGFGDAHLGAVYQRRDVRRVRVPKSRESL